jgi:hypothetical protein
LFVVADEREVVELQLPIQQLLHDCFEKERSILVDKINQLTSEIDNSRVAFDRYRDRARESLLKTATEQQAADSKITMLEEKFRVEHQRAESIEQDRRKEQQQHADKLRTCRADLERERQNLQSLRIILDDARRELVVVMAIEKDRYSNELNQANLKVFM